VQTPISYESQRLESAPSDHDVQDAPSDYDFGALKVEEIFARPKHQDPYGALNAASLHLSGALLASLDPKPQWKEFNNYPHSGRKVVLTKDGVTVGLLYPDTADEVTYAGRLFCLRIRNEPGYSESASSQISQPLELYESEGGSSDLEDEESSSDDGDDSNERHESGLVMGLVLEEDLDVENGYSRIGLARWVKESLFEDCQPCSITLL
jgi:hypothetical protein